MIIYTFYYDIPKTMGRNEEIKRLQWSYVHIADIDEIKDMKSKYKEMKHQLKEMYGVTWKPYKISKEKTD